MTERHCYTDWCVWKEDAHHNFPKEDPSRYRHGFVPVKHLYTSKRLYWTHVLLTG